MFRVERAVRALRMMLRAESEARLEGDNRPKPKVPLLVRDKLARSMNSAG